MLRLPLLLLSSFWVRPLMNLTIFRGGQADTDYCLGIIDSSGKERVNPPILLDPEECDPETFKRMVAGCSFAEPVFSCSLNYHVDDHPAMEQLLDSARTLQEALSVGVGVENTASLKILHQDKEAGTQTGSIELRSEIHLLMLEQVLSTGKKFTPYLDRFDRKRIDHTIELLNLKYGWVSSKDLERRWDGFKGNFGKDFRARNDRKFVGELKDRVLEGISGGQVKTRADVVDIIKSAGVKIQRGDYE
jgi:hypothetical protein